MTDAADLAAELETVVRAVPGVITLYPTAPLVATIVGAVIGAVVDAITQRETSPNLITVSTGKTGLCVSASIGVADADSAAGVCRLVHDAIAANPATRAAEPIDMISVTVASIG